MQSMHDSSTAGGRVANPGTTTYHFHHQWLQRGLTDSMSFATAAIKAGYSVAVVYDGEWETVTLTDTDYSTTIYVVPLDGPELPLGGGGEWEITLSGIEKIS